MKTKKECRYEPVNPATDSQPSTSLQEEPPITGDKPIMTVYQDSSPSASPPPQVTPWSEFVDPHLRGPYSVDHGRPLNQPFEPINPSSLSFQPPHAYPQTQYPVSWQQPYIQQQPTQPQYNYGHQGENQAYPATHGFWTGPRGSNVSYASYSDIF